MRSYVRSKTFASIVMYCLVGATVSVSWGERDAKDRRREQAKARNSDQNKANAQRTKAASSARSISAGMFGRKLQVALTLNLTAQQRTQIAALHSSAQAELESIRQQAMQKKSASGKGDKDAARANMRTFQPQIQAVHKKINDGIDSILTPDQRTELHAKMQQSGAVGRAGRKSDKYGGEEAVRSMHYAPTPTPHASNAVISTAATTNSAVANPFDD